MIEEGSISLSNKGAIAYLRLCRPSKMNALDASMVAHLRDACDSIEHDANTRVVIISGDGKGFCAGGDVQSWSNKSSEEFGRHWVRDGHVAFDALARLRQPVIAVLDGHALGGGLELATCADYRIAEEQVKIGQPETGLGIIPGWSGTQRAVRRFGAQIVRRMAMFGEVFNAREALELGIVDRVVLAGNGLSAAEDVAARVLRRAPSATELTKMLINAAEGEERERVLESLAGSVAAASPDLQVGLAAFHEKSMPDFNRLAKKLSASEGHSQD
jgi:enoyl-CoA hydratase/carnithine racemase